MLLSPTIVPYFSCSHIHCFPSIIFLYSSPMLFFFPHIISQVSYLSYTVIHYFSLSIYILHVRFSPGSPHFNSSQIWVNLLPRELFEVKYLPVTKVISTISFLPQFKVRLINKITNVSLTCKMNIKRLLCIVVV